MFYGKVNLSKRQSQPVVISISPELRQMRWHWEKTEEDFHALIAPDQIRQFETSIAARDAECLLGQLSDAQNIQMTQAQYKYCQS